MSEDGYRRLRGLAAEAGLDEGEFLSFLFEHWGSVINERNSCAAQAVQFRARGAQTLSATGRRQKREYLKQEEGRWDAPPPGAAPGSNGAAQAWARRLLLARSSALQPVPRDQRGALTLSKGYEPSSWLKYLCGGRGCETPIPTSQRGLGRPREERDDQHALLLRRKRQRLQGGARAGDGRVAWTRASSISSTAKPAAPEFRAINPMGEVPVAGCRRPDPDAIGRDPGLGHGRPASWAATPADTARDPALDDLRQPEGLGAWPARCGST
jgi:hypothetical protein